MDLIKQRNPGVGATLNQSAVAAAEEVAVSAK